MAASNLEWQPIPLWKLASGGQRLIVRENVMDLSTNDEAAKIISESRSMLLIERVRRCILAAGLFVAVLCAFWTDFKPYFVVSLPAKAQITSDEDDSGKIPTLSVARDAKLDEWFSSVGKCLRLGEIRDDWLFRLPHDDARDVKRYREKKTSFRPDIGRIVFGKDEAPLAQLLAGKKPGEETIILYGSPDDRQFLKVYFARSPALVGLGSSIYGVPEALSYPLRHLWYLPLAVCVLVYVIIPWPSVDANVCAYKRWQIVLSDFVGYLLYGMFMAMPIFVVGGVIQAVTTWWAFTALFWVLAAGGVCALWWSYFYSVYRIHLLTDQMVFICPKAIKAIPFSDIVSLESVAVVPPKWLVTASFLAAMLGTSSKGTNRVGATGRALILSNSSSSGFCIGTSSGDSLYIWATNSMGQNSFTNFEVLLARLKALPFSTTGEVRVIEAVFPPVIERRENPNTPERVEALR